MKNPILTLCVLFSFNICISQDKQISNSSSETFVSAQANLNTLHNNDIEVDHKVINNQLQSLKFKKLITKEMVYPTTLEGSGIEGVVVVEFDLLENGKIESLIVRKHLHKYFDSLVINKIKNLDSQFISQNFSPQKKMQIPIRFVVK